MAEKAQKAKGSWITNIEKGSNTSTNK